MARNIIEYLPEDAVTVDYASYDSSKTVLGPLIYRSTGATAEDNYLSPPPLGYDDPTQDTGLNDWSDISVIKYSSTKHWVFLQRGFFVVSNSVRIAAYEYDVPTSQYTYKGIINCATLDASANTWNGLKGILTTYSTGTVEVSGTTVTGSGSDWINKGISYGCRIGFGSTDPQSITNWYKITSFPEADRVGFNGATRTVAVDSSGNMYVGGEFTTFTDSSGTVWTANRIIKLSSDGTVDSTFMTNIGTGFNGGVLVIKIDPNTGKIVCGGGGTSASFTTFNGASSPYLIRLNTNGTVDTSLVVGTGFNNRVRDFVIDSSSSIYIVGEFTTWKGATNNYIIKIDSTGTKDATFDNTTGFNAAVYTICFSDTNTRIYVGGDFTAWKSIANVRIIKLDLTGTKDATFDNTTGFNNSVFSIVYDATNNQIAVGGAFTTWKGVSNTYLAKLSNTGTAISSSRSNSTVYNMVSYGNWIYVLGIMGSLGGTTCSQFGKVSLSTLDSDPNFDNNGAQPVSTGIVNGGSIGVTSDGSKIYVPSGDFGATSQNRGLTAYNTSDGSMDQTYHRLGVQKMTINSSPGTIPAGTPYVIEDLRFMISRLSNSTGIYMIKGVSMLDFIPATTSFVTPVHQLSFSSGAYYLIDTGSTTLATQIGFAPGIVVDTYVNENNQWIYAQNSTGRIAGFNIRKQLKCYATSRVRYGSLPTPTDYLLTNNPSIAGITAYHKAALCTTNTGTSAGVKSIFFTATSTMYQIPFSTIGHSLSFTSNSMAEIPPGSTTTYAATATMHRVHYLPEIDRFVILNGSTSGQKSYITSFKNNLITPTLSGTTWDRDSYNTLVNQNSFERAFLSWNRLLQNSSAAVGAPKYPDTGGTTYIFSADTVDGILHMVRPVNSSENIMYSIPVGADEQYVSTSNNVLITPKYEIPNLISITGLYFNVLREYGSSVYSIPPEPILIDYRTSGIDDNSGAWTKYEDIDSLNSALCNKTTNNVTIQFRFKFRVAGNTCVPNKLYGFVISYEDDRTDSHYSPSVAESSLASRIFAWQQQSSWGGTIPNLKIRIYNASNGDLLLYDTVSESSSGTWQYSTDGITWLAWSSSADAVGNYIRYTADYVPNGFKLRVGLNTV